MLVGALKFKTIERIKNIYYILLHICHLDRCDTGESLSGLIVKLVTCLIYGQYISPPLYVGYNYA